MSKQNKNDYKKEFEIFRINSHNIICTSYKENQNDFKIKTFVAMRLETIGGMEHLTQICEEIKNFKFIVKLPFEQRALMFIFKHLRANGYPILLTDLFDVRDFMKLKVFLGKTFKILRSAKIPVVYYKNLINRLKEHLLTKNIQIREYNEDEMINKIAYKQKAVVLILTELIGRKISITLFKHWQLDLFCSFHTFRLVAVDTK
ncbi:hypothetical protein CDIK_0732 [Cucumispora dikerogammari]|nr:hypothetical protein CDIK_0732 [Cucumispora dikerogammari]